mmetsp:Transcript_1686/g.5558  ORF Transcript_1686/g.5558 Transcript_1686/m.5558 type:complete len:240 (+) Transcript_1686:521-1240(+)
MHHVSVVVAHPHGDGAVRRLAGGEAHQPRASGRLEDGDGLPGGGESLHATAGELRHENGAVAADGDADGGVEEAWRAPAAANHAARLVGRESGSALPAGGRERESAEAVRPVVRNDELRTAVVACGQQRQAGGEAQVARAKGADPREALRRVDRNHAPRQLLARPADIAHVKHTLVQQRAPRVHQPAMHPPRLRHAARRGNATTDAALARGRTRIGAVAAILAPAAVAATGGQRRRAVR